MVERLENRAINQRIAWARHFTLLACPCTYCKSFWIRASAKWMNVNVGVSREKIQTPRAGLHRHGALGFILDSPPSPVYSQEVQDPVAKGGGETQDPEMRPRILRWDPGSWDETQDLERRPRILSLGNGDDFSGAPLYVMLSCNQGSRLTLLITGQELPLAKFFPVKIRTIMSFTECICSFY